MKHVTISPGNRKLGANILTVNLSAIVACGNCKACRKACYALKAQHRFPSCKASRYKNMNIYKKDSSYYFNDIHETLIRKRKPVHLFRWHSSGDILDLNYLHGMICLANKHKNIKFLCFTKMFDILSENRRKIPANLQIVCSIWPGMVCKLRKYPRAYVKISDNDIIPDNAIECPGSCDSCGLCWNLSEIKRDVYFHIH